MRYLNLRLIACLAVITLLFSCKKDPANNPGDVINLNEVRLNDFHLEETVYTNINITHPVITNGVETQFGEIRVTIPAGTTQLQLTPKASNFTTTGYTVSPQLGQRQNFLNRIVIYTIVSKQDASKLVHYAVTIIEEQPQPTGPAALTSFRFEKTKNSFLPSDIEATRIIDGVATLGKVFIFVPVGTSFASLTPTINYQGTGLFYSQDPNASPNNVTTVYPAAGRSIDFTWPKVFYAIVRNGAEIKTYEVVVDVRSPIRFASSAVSASVMAGSSHFMKVGTFQNQGNHPISIIGVDHSNQLPAGSNAVRGSGIIPSGGLLPGREDDVFATISAQIWPAGTYGVTANFRPRFVNHPEADDLLESSALRISSTIIQ